MAKVLFLTPLERQRRIEALMKLHGWTNNRLSIEMKVGAIAVRRAFWKRPDCGTYADVHLSTIKKVARALGVSVGYLVDVGVKR